LSGSGKVIETQILLSGKDMSSISDKDIAFNIGQGKICYIPPYTLHNVINTGTEPLVYIYCVTPVKSTENHSKQHEHHH
jgi:oxalate decarboxylase/phosphoglucose isomerase-like protein (cupin superfamily)